MTTDTRATIKPLQVTIKQAAELLSFHPITIHTMIRKGNLKATGRGKGRRVVYSSLEQWVKKQSQ